jgi:hypothetical protein
MDIVVQVLVSAAATVVGEAVVGVWRGWMLRQRHAI